jgi:hypothetical protein
MSPTRPRPRPADAVATDPGDPAVPVPGVPAPGPDAGLRRIVLVLMATRSRPQPAGDMTVRRAHVALGGSGGEMLHRHAGPATA